MLWERDLMSWERDKYFFHMSPQCCRSSQRILYQIKKKTPSDRSEVRKFFTIIIMCGTQGGGGGYSHFFSYVGSGPASTVHPKKYQEFQAPQKNI